MSYTKEEYAKKAREHEARMSDEYAKDIIRSISMSKAYSLEMLESKEFEPVENKHMFINQDTVNALFSINNYEGAKRICLLNFASYKYPGGMFMNGSFAQEEALCHYSTLYNVLSGFNDKTGYYDTNRKELNKGLYKNKAIYSKDIIFFDPLGKDSPLLADVLTCAAPNKSILEKYHSFTEEENTQCLKERIHLINLIAQENEVKTLIVGAWGCGVFRQDAKQIAKMLKEEFNTTSITNIVYAVPGDDYNAQIFKEELI